MNSVTAHDYAWTRTSPLFRHMMESGYTLTLIRGRAPREVLRAMEPASTVNGRVVTRGERPDHHIGYARPGHLDKIL